MKRGSLIILLLLGVFLIGIISVLPMVSAEFEFGQGCYGIIDRNICANTKGLASGPIECSGSEVVQMVHDCVLRILPGAKVECVDGLDYEKVLYDCGPERGMSYCISGYVYITYDGNCNNPIVHSPNSFGNFEYCGITGFTYCNGDPSLGNPPTEICLGPGESEAGSSPNGGARCIGVNYPYDILQSKPLFFKTILAILLIILVLVAIIYFKPRSINKRNKNKKGRR